MFLGTHTPRVDDKGRLAFPAKFRPALADGLVITKGQEHCLYVFTLDTFTGLAAELNQSLTADAATRAYNRVFFASAHDETPDGQGRVTLPARLRAYAGIERDVVVNGAANRIEIWNARSWDEYLDSSEKLFSHGADDSGTADDAPDPTQPQEHSR
ncbi:division/cell wall cluster transcriptional repressor MraZ [Haloglycomyces albus]|uniref:division/cell wall cluster transcriptional repressor MraZ n=1 Tax=Haloglycomyces albus TaxID=526067 RepID=UPI00046D1AA3|nr:division/cell wall cluster transcriptional repressor MraZ [Haloglycomyces albus]